jgi:hypothetical protein
MKLITEKQMQFFLRKRIAINSLQMLPRWGFIAYEQPYLSSECVTVDTNPFTKSLDHELIIIKKKINGFCKVNFYKKPYKTDFYIEESLLEKRDLIEMVFIILSCYIPFVFYNLFNRLWTVIF